MRDIEYRGNLKRLPRWAQFAICAEVAKFSQRILGSRHIGVVDVIVLASGSARNNTSTKHLVIETALD